MSTPDPQHLAELHGRLVREANALVRAAKLNGDGQAVVPIGQLNRVSRELRGEPQPSGAWMSA